ncbi:MAG: ribonuclease H-like domain-containing protein [Clostridia bacterium]|nr:ribonuclease H-like domain-containing protein [Clostridia bacterium]
MRSLREKLQATARQPVVKKQAAVDCQVKEIRVPAEAFLLPERIAADNLYLMLGGQWQDVKKENILFLDTETTGLSHGAGTVAFLVGIGYFEEESFVVRQYLMRDYDEEIFLLQRVLAHLGKKDTLCTFNGASFDMPLLDARFTMQRMRNPYHLQHIDLLHVARRVWKLRLKSCRLSRLEEMVLGITREDDLPGAMVPERYFQYLKTKDEALLADILEHNAQDIISLAHLLHQLVVMHESPCCAAQKEDVFSLGRVYEMRGRMEGARMCYRAADKGSLSALARARIAETYRREGSTEQAAKVYESMIRSGQGGIAPMVAMAKICEHKRRDIPSALEYTRKAIILCAEKDGGDMAALQKRFERLMKKARKD